MSRMNSTDHLDNYLQASERPDNVGSLNMTLYICYGIDHTVDYVTVT